MHTRCEWPLESNMEALLHFITSCNVGDYNMCWARKQSNICPAHQFTCTYSCLNNASIVAVLIWGAATNSCRPIHVCTLSAFFWQHCTGALLLQFAEMVHIPIWQKSACR